MQQFHDHKKLCKSLTVLRYTLNCTFCFQLLVNSVIMLISHCIYSFYACFGLVSTFSFVRPDFVVVFCHSSSALFVDVPTKIHPPFLSFLCFILLYKTDRSFYKTEAIVFSTLSLCLLIAYRHQSLLVLTKLHSLTKLGTWGSFSTLTSQ